LQTRQQEIQRQKIEDQKEPVRSISINRFGTDLLGPEATEAELLAYAQMLSEETYNSGEHNRRERESSAVGSSPSSDTIAAQDSSFPPREFSSSSSPTLDTVEELAPDIAEAIRLSLLDENS